MNLNRSFVLACVLSTLLVPFASAQQAENAEATALKQGGTTYFTSKMENLTTKLNLSPEQQAKLRPIAEQETGLFEEVRGNAALSQKERLAKLQQIVIASDKQMKPWLSEEQWQKLQALRKDQQGRLKELAKQK